MLENPKTPLIIPTLGPLYDGLAPFGYVLLRAVAGGMVATFGATKLFTEGGAQADIDIIRQIGFEPAEIWAYFVIWLEFLGGIAIVIGALTRPVAAMFVGLFGVILVAVMIPRGANYQLAALWLAAFAYIALKGGGKISLDRLIGREF